MQHLKIYEGDFSLKKKTQTQTSAIMREGQDGKEMGDKEKCIQVRGNITFTRPALH